MEIRHFVLNPTATYANESVLGNLPHSRHVSITLYASHRAVAFRGLHSGIVTIATVDQYLYFGKLLVRYS